VRRILLIIILSLIVIVVGGVAWVWWSFPRDIPVEEISIEQNAENIERGRYMVEHVAFCWSCHASLDWNTYSAPVVAGTRGRGGSNTMFGDEGVYARNITPFALGTWSDGEIRRVITSGIRRDGKPVHPQMPYFTYRRMTQKDLHGVIAYLRSLEPVAYEPPASETPLWIDLVARLLPRPYTPPEPPSSGDTVERGLYLVRLAECRACHLPSFRGGFELKLPDGSKVRSGDLLARVEQMDRQTFVDMFKSRMEPRPLGPNESNTPMPWQHYAGMTSDDLGAIYDYLASRVSRSKSPEGD